MRVSPLHLACVVSTLVMLLPAGVAAAASREEQAVKERVAEVLDRLEAEGDYLAAEAALQEIFDGVVAHVQVQRAGAFVEAAWPLRMVRQLAQAELATADALLPYLRINPTFARTLAFLARPEHEDMAEVYALANRLRQERPDKLNDYAHLAAAICVVHDKPLVRNYNENRVSAPDPIELFDYYIANERAQYFGLTDIPAELLVYVVDVTATMEDLRWAVSRFAGDPQVGARFFDIQYDHEHYRTGAPKKSTLLGWGLANIAQYGGVCADQAYFAVTVGKAIGVPTAYTYGRGSDTSHAWVGFLEADPRAKRAWWNFDYGRFSDYLFVRGVLLDPQIRQSVPDSFVSLLADFALSKSDDRNAVIALTDAAMRLRELEQTYPVDAGDDEPKWFPTPILENARTRGGVTLRTPELKYQLNLLETGVRLAPGYPQAWFVVRDLAEAGRLTFGEKRQWTEVLSRLCGGKYPDFMMEILRPMVTTIEDVREQNAFWNRAFNQFQRRADLCAEIRMAQAAMWEEAGEIDEAGRCYLDVIERYANAGPFVVNALTNAERLLKEKGETNSVLELYANTWQYIEPPDGEMAGVFAVQSNWFRVGRLYAERLDAAGLQAEASQVRDTIGLR